MDGVILTSTSTPFGAWAWAVAVAVAGAIAGALSGTVAGVVAAAGALSGAFIGGKAVDGTVAMLGGWAVILYGVVTMARAFAEEKLLKSFSPFHTFLILASPSLAGLGLGWLGYWASKVVSGH